MKMRTMNSFVSAMAVAGAILFTMAPASDNAWAGTVPAAERGGQPAPPASGGQGEFVVVIASGLAQTTADQLQKGLVADGFTTAEARTAADGKYRVVVGGLPSRGQADRVLDQLRKSGYTPQGVDNPGASAASGAGDTIYRVEVADFASEAEAESAQKTLAADGFVNVDVVPENGKYLLMLGTFNRRQDAQALLSEVSGAGFALARVTQRQRLRGTGSTASADLSGLPANQQAATREVLAMVEKVERGEASADEIKQLREQIQQLTQGQKNVLSQQENTRATEREKLQKIFPLYREFDHAMTARDYDTAEQALEKVRQIDPNDIFLAGRTRALEQARSGVTTDAAGSTGRADPAVVQATINEARKLESEGQTQQALAKYREVVTMDATNSEARGKVAQLSSGANASASASADSNKAEAGGLMQNKNLLYGAIGLVALVIIGLFLKSRKSKSAPESTTPASSFGGTDFGDPLAGGDSFASAGESAAGASAAPGTPSSDEPAFATFGDMEDDTEEKPVPAPAPTPIVTEESDVVSLDEPEAAPTAPAASTQPEEESISINFADDEPNAQPPATGNAPAQAAAAGSSALDADLESMLKGTFPGAPADASSESVLESATPGRGVEELKTEEQATSGSEPRLVFSQSFDDEADGAAPRDWRGEYDYASLTVQKLDEAGHTQALCFHKPEGTGSATYHLTFPQATGRVTAEFDIRCDRKNKFLLGVYLEKDEDFKQSVHTIVHQLDANSPAALRIQGAPTPYDMGTWRHVRYEIDLQNGTVDGFVDNEQVATGAALANAPEYVNTLSIRDNLATTGTLLLDNIQISEA